MENEIKNIDLLYQEYDKSIKYIPLNKSIEIPIEPIPIEEPPKPEEKATPETKKEEFDISKIFGDSVYLFASYVATLEKRISKLEVEMKNQSKSQEVLEKIKQLLSNQTNL